MHFTQHWSKCLIFFIKKNWDHNRAKILHWICISVLKTYTMSPKIFISQQYKFYNDDWRHSFYMNEQQPNKKRKISTITRLISVKISLTLVNISASEYKTWLHKLLLTLNLTVDIISGWRRCRRGSLMLTVWVVALIQIWLVIYRLRICALANKEKDSHIFSSLASP